MAYLTSIQPSYGTGQVMSDTGGQELQ